VIKAPCDQDRRVIYVQLTPKAQAIRKPFEDISDVLVSTAYKGFSDDEKEFLVKLLLRVRENF